MGNIPIQGAKFSFLVNYESVVGKIQSVKITLGDDFHKLSPREQREQLRENLQMTLDDEDFLNMDFDERLEKERFVVNV